MRKSAVSALLVLCAVAFTAASTAASRGVGPPTRFGVAEDAMQWDAGLFGSFRGAGLRVARMTVTFNGSDSINNQGGLDAAAAAAKVNGVQLIFSLYPSSPKVPDAQVFCGWVKKVAERYVDRGVTRYIVGNEVNATRFWSPQHTSENPNYGATTYGATLALCYDTLKGVNASVQVIGMGLAPRAVDKNSTAPLEFIRQVGVAYKASGRTRPIMDAIAVHPYPNPNAKPGPAPLAAGYENPDFYGIPQIQRVRDAISTAFKGTNQPATENGLGIVIDEIGYQTDEQTQMNAGYTGTENSPVVSEEVQADYYKQIIRYYACDQTITDVLFFHLVDEKALQADASSGGWQSGIMRPDGSKKPSYASVERAQTQGCDSSLLNTVSGGKNQSATATTPSSVPSATATTPSSVLSDTYKQLDISLEYAKNAYQKEPSYTTDGDITEWLAACPSGSSCSNRKEDLDIQNVNNAAKHMASGLTFFFKDDKPLTMPPLFWDLPTKLKEDALVTTVQVFIPSCSTRRASSARMESSFICRVFSQNPAGGWTPVTYHVDMAWLLGTRAGSFRICVSRLDIPLEGGANELCVNRSLQAANKTRLLISGKGTVRLKKGARLKGQMKQLISLGPGVYKTFVILRPTTGKAKPLIISTRPQVVTIADAKKRFKAALKNKLKKPKTKS